MYTYLRICIIYICILFLYFRLWLERREKHRRRMYNRYKEKPFNDLWIKMDDDRFVF